MNNVPGKACSPGNRLKRWFIVTSLSLLLFLILEGTYGGNASQTKTEHVLCAFSKLLTHFLKRIISIFESKCLRNLKMIYCANIILINNLRTVWLTKILLSFLCFSDNLLRDTYTFFSHSSVDEFKIAHKMCSILVWGAVPSLLGL